MYTFHTLPVAGATLQMGGPIRFNITSPHRECIVDHRAGPRANDRCRSRGMNPEHNRQRGVLIQLGYCTYDAPKSQGTRHR